MSFTLKKPSSFEIFVKKSRFLTHGFPLDNTEQIREHLHSIEQTYPTATHHCWAWRFKALAQCSDAGEPSGTAGKPILHILTQRDLDKTLIIVSRWFGGIKLGAGGLIRAYGGATRDFLNDAPLMEIIPQTQLKVTVPLEKGGILHARLNYWQVTMTQPPHYGAKTTSFTLCLPTSQRDELASKIENLTAGKADLEEIP